MKGIATNRTPIPLPLLLAATGWLAPPTVAQEEPPEPPPRNAKAGDFARFPLGPIGGRGEVLAGDTRIHVLALSEAGPGLHAGLRIGDLITGAGRSAFPEHTRDIDTAHGPMTALGDAIEAAEADDGRLALRVRRAEEDLTLTVQLPALGAIDLHDPLQDDKALEFYDGICRDLLRTRREDGAWKSNTGEDATRYVTALCGLALLGRGDARHRPELDMIATFLAGPQRRGYVSEDLTEPAGLSNWFITMSGIYLAEHVLATGDEQWLPTIQHLCDCLAARQTEEGRYGHGISVGYGGKGFNIINTHAHLLWALAARAGCTIDEAAWQRSFREIEKSTGENGGVRYWTLQTGYWDSCARTGQMALALSLTDRQPALRERMGGYLEEHRGRMREAHAMGSIGMIFGTAALRRVNPAGWNRHMDTWRWYLTLMRQPDGSAEYIGGKRNNGGDSYLGPAHVANAIAGLMLASGLGHLHLCGNDEQGWLAR
ncbi:MAG: hypothetical protein E2O39_04820 [Planctomycetota bacterium]|nr:MAG: hypothetical protein E2O39_04820 [Planctomycetota bacterium]